MRAGRRDWAVIGVVIATAMACSGNNAGTPTSIATTTNAVRATTAGAASTVSASTIAASEPTASATSAVTTSAPVSVADTSVPAGTKLRIADQFGLFQGLLAAAGMDKDIPYDVSYLTLYAGPLQLQAFRAGDADMGVVSPLGLIQAAASDVNARALARWRTDFAQYALISAPGVDDIHGWADLRGRRVAFQRDTMGEALVMLALDEAGMTLDDIDVIDVAHADVDTVLQRGDADAGVTGEPFVSLYLEANPTATKVIGIETPTAQSTIIVVSDNALDDPAKAAAVAEYIARLDRAFTKVTSDRAAFVDIAVAVWHLDRAYAEQVLATSDGVRMERVPGDLVVPYQRLIDLLVQRGDVDADLDATSLFDSRYDGLLQP
jgi:sulfonate transport system substrate-binding protein